MSFKTLNYLLASIILFLITLLIVAISLVGLAQAKEVITSVTVISTPVNDDSWQSVEQDGVIIYYKY